MKNPFKKDDVVHHTFYGEGVVLNPEAPNHVANNGRIVLVEFEQGELRQYAPQELSYKPWPKPDHNRPLDEGLYIVRFRNDRHLALRIFVKGEWHSVTANLTPGDFTRATSSDYIIIKKLD